MKSIYFRVIKFILTILFLKIVNVRAQMPISITHQTTKIGALSTTYFYFGFKAGDVIQLDFEEQRKKGLKEVEILEYPNHSIYSEYESKRIDKQIVVPQTGIYKFRFYNASLGKRIAKININRIPIDDSEQFDSKVYWRTLYDTSYTTVEEKYLESIDTSIVNLTRKTTKVNSLSNQNGNRQYFNFSLPSNTIKWTYYIGVGQESQKALELATKELLDKAGPLVAKMPGYGPLAALALGGLSYIPQLQKGEEVEFYLVNGENLNLLRSGQNFYPITKGKVINEVTALPYRKDETLYFYLINDNAIVGISVSIDITAVTVTENWKTRTIQVPKITSYQVPYLKQ